MEASLETKTNKSGLNKHAIIMILCCLIPIAVLGILWAIGVSSVFLTFSIILLCPLMHVILTIGTSKKNGDGSVHSH